MTDEIEYVFFHEDGPITLTETELCNAYMKLYDHPIFEGQPRTPEWLDERIHQWQQTAEAALVETENLRRLLRRVAESSLFSDRLRALADQAAQSADDTGSPILVGRDEWFALMDAIYESDEDDTDE